MPWGSLFLTVLVAKASAAAADGDTNGRYYWPHARGHPEHYGQSPYAFGGPNCNLSASLKWKWHHPAGRYHTLVVGKPIFDEKKDIYLAIAHGIRKFSPDGKVLWAWDVDDVRKSYVMDTPAIMDGMLFDCETKGRAFALDMGTGRLLWEKWVTAREIPGDQGFVTARDGRVFLDAEPQVPGVVNNKVVALNATDGSILWEFRPSPGVWNFLPMFPGDGKDGTMIFQTWNGAAYRLNVADGKQLWRSGPTNTHLFTDGGPALGPNGVFYTVSHEGTMADIGGARKPGGLRAYRVSDGQLLWERTDLAQGIFTYPVVGRLGGGDKLSVVVGVGVLCGMPWQHTLLGFWTGHVPKDPNFRSLFVAIAVVALTCQRMRRTGSVLAHACKACLWAAVLTAVVGQVAFHCYVPVLDPPRRQYTVRAFEAETGEPQWSVDLPEYAWYSAAGDESGFITRMMLGQREVSLPSASNYPTLDAQGIYYQGYQDGNFYQIKDWNGDGVIDKSTEMCVFNMGTCAFTAGPSIVPGMLATVTSDGLYVFGQ